MRLKNGQEGILPYLVVGLCSEAFCVQMRGLATGSDGLAEIVDDDLLSVILPKMLNPSGRTEVEKLLEQMMMGESSFAKFAKTLLDDMPKYPSRALRKNHWALV